MSNFTEHEQKMHNLTLCDAVRAFTLSTKGWRPDYVRNTITTSLRVVLVHYSTHQYIRRGWMPKECLNKPLDGLEYKVQLLHAGNDIEGHPPTSIKQGRVLERVIFKILGAIRDYRLVWSPKWVQFAEVQGGDDPDRNMEIIERREIGYITGMFRAIATGMNSPLAKMTDLEIFQEKEGYREWALSKFIENFMRQWFTSYTGDPGRDGETCKKRVHGKTRFRWAFCEGPTAPAADVAEMLMGIYEEAEGEINDEAAKRKKQKKIDRERSTVLARRVKNTLRWSGFKEDRLDERISEMQQQLERLKGKKKEEQNVRDWCENQRAAFLMPLVSKGLWNVFKESGENAGERIFECPSDTTVRMVQVLKCIHMYGARGFDLNRDVWAMAHPELAAA